MRPAASTELVSDRLQVSDEIAATQGERASCIDKAFFFSVCVSRAGVFRCENDEITRHTASSAPPIVMDSSAGMMG